ncbi:phosphotransferase family protein [Streptomyces sp. NPDC048496]|uniref:phosphotransferase family protein n=1 Tax=Streptomyces sp. NPDC048496 TaxID=3365558 RepID=UPI0037193395
MADQPIEAPLAEPHGAAAVVQSSTHGVEVLPDAVIKRFRSSARGEPVREWRALTLLAQYAPGLAPQPLKSDLDGDPPTVVMARLDGAPLRGTTVTGGTAQALAESLATLHTAVPRQVLETVPEGAWNVIKAVDKARDWCGQQQRFGPDPAVERAFAEGRRWLEAAPLDDLVKAEPVPVFGLTDGNLANYLFDGTRVRMVDFEDSGRSDRAFELAELAEHPSGWVDSTLDVAALLGHFPLGVEEVVRLTELRRLLALLWLVMLLPGRPGHARNPAGTVERQAVRLLALLG